MVMEGSNLVPSWERLSYLVPFFCLLPSHSIAPALLRQASYGTLKIGLYHYFKKLNPGGMCAHSMHMYGWQ